MVMFHSYVSLPWNIIEKHDPSWLGGHVRGHKVGWPVAPLGREGIWFGKANEHGLRTLQIRCVEWKHVATHLTTFPKWQELCYFTGQVTHFLTAWPVSSLCRTWIPWIRKTPCRSLVIGTCRRYVGPLGAGWIWEIPSGYLRELVGKAQLWMGKYGIIRNKIW